MTKHLVIVESPAKVKTISKFLGPDYLVEASIGHVLDLPARNPKGVKTPVPGIDLDNNFQPSYEVIKGKNKTLSKLKKAAKESEGIWLATDLDREGEAIAWLLAEAMKVEPEKVKRVVFNAITKDAIQQAFQNPREIDVAKVNAQQARRILDRTIGRADPGSVSVRLFGSQIVVRSEIPNHRLGWVCRKIYYFSSIFFCKPNPIFWAVLL